MIILFYYLIFLNINELKCKIQNFVCVCVCGVNSSFLNGVLLKTFYPQTVHLCTYVCSHFGCTNVCYFSFVFCLISPIFCLILFFNVMSSCVALASPFPPPPPPPPPLPPPLPPLPLLMCWCWRLSLTLLHTSGLQNNMVPVRLPLPSSSSKISVSPFFFPNPCYCFFFFLLYFFSILVPNSTRQSWESTMPPPVSK